MKKLIVFVLFISTECTQKINVTSSNKEVNIQYGDKSKNNTDAVLYFMDGFSEKIIIKKNDSIEFNEFIKTNESLSSAFSFYIKNLKKGDLIQLEFGKEIIKFNFNEKYPQIEIYNFQNLIKINFSKFNQKNLE